ncbi:LPD7 domain-containing protein [Aminobacter sp. MSH1]|uniref:LPD7 domain-containing protein n=1 Tax=Aminobacter sp. MSH1 TaxID=374606 RepID=UPI000D398390|nr:LPD7 domain-containing protein [Aminobacter sp. MSH1]
MATMTNDAPESGRRPDFGIMMVDFRPATSVRFERTERANAEEYTLSFHFGGKQVARFKDLDGAALEGLVGEANSKTIRDRQENRGTLTGDSLVNVHGFSPAELARQAEIVAGREAEQGKAELAAAYVDGMSKRHPARQDAETEGQWTVQTRGPDGLYRDVVTTDNAHDAHRLYLSGSHYRVIDNELKDYAADYEEHRVSTVEGKPISTLQHARYHERSTFKDAIRDREPNAVKLDPPRERSNDVDVGEALDAARAQRERDRKLIDQQRDQIADNAHRVSVLDKDATRRDRANDLDELAGRKPDFAPLVMTEHEKNRRIELTERIHSQFRVHGSEFRFKDQPAKTAFRDDGNVLKTATNDDRVAKAMVTMAEAKGWKTISVSGHPDFRREAWLEASLRGMEVKGYKPQQQDLQDLAALRERQERNTIEPVPERARSGRDVGAAAERQQEAVQRPQEAIREPQAAATAAARQEAPRSAERAYSGVLLAHGAANYRHDPQERPSYYAIVATAKGEETVWGKDLQRSLADSGAKIGEAVKIAFGGDKSVTVDANKRDAAGKVIGTEPIDTRRNSWNVSMPQESERAAVLKAVAAAVMADKVKDPAHRELVLQAINDRVDRADKAGRLPPVQVYDHTAPTRDAGVERARPQVERKAERTR